MERIDLKSLSLEALDAWLGEIADRPFRRRQIRSWLYARRALSFEAMTDLPLDLRRTLGEKAELMTAVSVETSASGGDGAVKHLLRLRDGETIEAVFMPGERRTTICVSSQVGCPLDCAFCETGRWGFRRDLTQGEILDQIILLTAGLPADAPQPNLVFMGMGEPLLNPDALAGALEILHGEMGFGARRVTVSTAGVPDGIRRLAESPFRPGLALSLNASRDELRAALMPRAARRPIAELLDACEAYARATGRRVTLEYVLIAGINDGEEDAAGLRALTRGRPFKVNIIPYNPGRETLALEKGPRRGELRRPAPAEVERFVGRLLPQVPAVTVRWSQGTEVDGGCGQLRGRHIVQEGLKGSKPAGD